jgi:hypothetical protein
VANSYRLMVNQFLISAVDPMLILKRASKHRPDGQWSDDDYDVINGDQHVGRIMWTHAASRDTPWFWTITARVPQSPYDRGYAATREEAMADFKTRCDGLGSGNSRADDRAQIGMCTHGK